MSLLQHIKLTTSARTQMAFAALMWSSVGLGLFVAGWRWAHCGSLPARPWLVGAAVLTGMAKGWFVLRRSAVSILARIRARGDGRSLLGVLSARTWLLILAMMATGRALRAWVLPLGWAGLLYVWVGVALLTGSLFLWRAALVRSHEPAAQVE